MEYNSFCINRILNFEQKVKISLREKCPNTEFSRIRSEYGEIRSYLSIFSPNAGKSGPEKTPYLDTFHALYFGELAFVAVIIFDKKITFENYFRLKLPETIYNWIYLI